MLACGMTEFGLSDHYHTAYNLCDIQSAANDFRCCKRPAEFHFGIELTCMAKWECDAIRQGKYEFLGDDPVYGLRYNEPPENADFSPCLDIDEATLKQLGVEYTIGGAHWPRKVTRTFEEACDDIFVQMMFLAENPLVDILAHPWYTLSVAHSWDGWMGMTGQPKFSRAFVDESVYAKIPTWMNEKLGETLIRNGTLMEINVSDLAGGDSTSESKDTRWRMLSSWREMGVKFVFGTDQHSEHCNKTLIQASELLLDLYGFKEEDFVFGFPKKNKKF